MKGPADPLLVLSFKGSRTYPVLCTFLRPNYAPAAFHDLPIAVLLAAPRNTADTKFDSQLST